MDQQITFRQLNNTYGRKAINLILPIQRNEFGVDITEQDQPDVFDIENCYYGFWGAMAGEELVGTIGLIKIGQGAGVIRKMFVAAAYRGSKFHVAQDLLRLLISEAKKAGITDLYLGTVNVMKAAQAFYTKNGFAQLAKTDLPDSFPVMRHDNVFYHLAL